MPATPRQTLPDDIARAARVMEKLINNRLFPHGRPDHPQFLTTEASVGIGLEKQEKNAYDADGRQDELVQITLRDPHIEVMPSQVRETVTKILSEIPVVAQQVALEKPEEHATHIKDKLTKLIDAGANIDKRVLEWKGFIPEIAKATYDIPNHALEITRQPTGMLALISIRKNEANKHSSTIEEAAVADNIQARVGEIKKTLIARLEKYLPSESPQSVAEAVNNLHIEVSGSNNNAYSTVAIFLRSPEQQQAYLSDKKMTGEEEQALRESNILSRQQNGLSDEQLNKALSRAFLYTGETAIDIFPMIAGREDIKRHICKSLTKFKEAHPDQAAAVDEVLNDDMFKEHKWQGKEVFKQPVLFNKSPDKTGEMTVQLYLPEGKAWEVVKAIADVDRSLAPTPATPPQELKMASVDSLELVGVHSPDPAVHQEMQVRLAPLMGRPVTARQPQAMENFALTLIRHIEEAHQSFMESIRRQAQEKPGASPGVDNLAANIISHMEQAHNVVEEAKAQFQSQPVVTPTPTITLADILPNIKLRPTPEFSVSA